MQSRRIFQKEKEGAGTRRRKWKGGEVGGGEGEGGLGWAGHAKVRGVSRSPDI